METKNKFKLFLPKITEDSNSKITLLSADVRSNVTYIALYETVDKKVVQKHESSYPTKDFASFSEIANRFISDFSLSGISKIAVAVPGPVIGGKSAPVRLPWTLDSEEIQAKTQVEKVYLINDMEASSYGLGNADESNFLTIHQSENFIPGNIAVLAPGAGLGEAGLFWDGDTLRPFATEGGHCEFSPRTNEEVEFYQFLQKIYGIVTWESVLSTSGLFNIYRFLRDVKQQKQPEWLTKEIEADNFTDALINGALENKDRICKMTVDAYIMYLAREANSLVLKLKATGGLFLSGEIPVKLQQYLKNDKFYQSFIVSDKMEVVLKDIPIYLVKDEQTIINGAALYAAFS